MKKSREWVIWTSWSYSKIRSPLSSQGMELRQNVGEGWNQTEIRSRAGEQGEWACVWNISLGNIDVCAKKPGHNLQPNRGFCSWGVSEEEFFIACFLHFPEHLQSVFFFLWKPFPSVQHYRWGGQTWQCSHQTNSVMQSLRSLCKSSSLNGKYFSFYFEIIYIFCWCGNTKSANH